MAYDEIYARWKNDPEGFWMDAAEAIDWVEKPSKALFEGNAPLYEWFSDGKVNACWNAVDRHVEAGRGEQAAIIYDSPITHSKRWISYVELRNRVASLAGALRAKGVEKGDRVIIYMPMVPEALEAMLACARIGAVHSVVFGGFAAHELAIGWMMLDIFLASAFLWLGHAHIGGRIGHAVRNVEDVSYGIYILHWPIGLVAFALMPGLNTTQLALIMAPAAILAGWVLRETVEKPALAWKDRLQPRRKVRVAAV